MNAYKKSRVITIIVSQLKNYILNTSRQNRVLKLNVRAIKNSADLEKRVIILQTSNSVISK